MIGMKRTGTKRASSFASQQARLARDAIDDALEIGERLFENSQGLSEAFVFPVESNRFGVARILLTWYYYSQARWIDVSGFPAPL